MLVALPVGFYTGTLAAFAVYTALGTQFWLNAGIALSIAGAGGAAAAALPGAIDLLFGIPPTSRARRVGLAHGGLNVIALGLFIAVALSYVSHWNGPPTSPTLGLALASAGVAITVAAGSLGWVLIQSFHVGIRLTPRQEEDEGAVQAAPAMATFERRTG
jgi:uncharacterized membrane protein